VTHELDSIFSIANNSIFLDNEQQTIVASGDPHNLLQENTHPHVHAFLSRGEEVFRGKKLSGEDNLKGSAS